MTIKIRRSGGFSGPLLNKAWEIRTDSLPPQSARKLKSLLAAAPLASLQGRHFKSRTGNDLFHFEVIVETSENPVDFFFEESAVPALFKPIWNFLRPQMKD
jgi:hypothetical protein